MKIVSVNDILNEKIIINTQVVVQGWVRTRRDSKAKISFLAVYDGSCFATLQVIINHTLCNYQNDVLHLTTGCSVKIEGRVVKSIGNKQKFEVQATMVEILGWVHDPNTYPISAKWHSMEHLRKVVHLRPRTNIIGVISRIRHILAQTIHCYMNEQGFFWITTPIITACDTEGTSKMFRVSTLDLENLPYTSYRKINYKKDFFGREVFLTVSGQLNCESYACALSKVYTFGPTFRAEESNTNHHLAEFWMLEPEMAFANLEDISFFVISLLKHVVKILLNECEDDILFLSKRIDKNIFNRLENFINNKLICITYNEVVDILKKFDNQFIHPISWGKNLGSEHERFLTETYFKSPIIIINYPKDTKAFYMRLNDDFKTVAAMDLIVPIIGEIVGGSQREERLDILDLRLEELGLNKENYCWYRDLRRYGTVPHSGFGLGFERLLLYITGMQNIKDVIPFPRYPDKVDF
ncbi:asparagine--tRNA ligase [Blochmannia endosymbiont of Camponotus (Colobopsis) obliquus]|uniref:asparagine--tRNA ligase n=1 Tax=Blochmannia endosymbiont of Camponotus (Colobopsis) obliquus TaxID=1505597 RepID=UPI00061A7846|nr:asparagine--tRNA ligase [Blochmannia endosymbiont of Camponotus (Colobopsis) obliquus]AKC60577.1 asparagine--tRNA ligase [Blochmannia endosymbiont of Camponotus (Colobopsis) obliquus]